MRSQKTRPHLTLPQPDNAGRETFRGDSRRSIEANTELHVVIATVIRDGKRTLGLGIAQCP